MPGPQKDRLEELMKHLAAEFLSIYSNRTSMITVTRVEAAERSNLVTIYFTVLPEDKEEAAIDFLKRNRSDFRAYVKYNARLMRIPFFDFAIDKGEKARQKIEEGLAK
ncbi:MAG TPA: ribosome-binding factor A [Candidatus Paceibacterota bacterium]|nr:ribosome-binding factor A [Candidatus Paceibacterota bacterium]